MINKIYSKLASNDDNSNEEPTITNTLDEQQAYQDCLPCKITGALGFGGLGAYALREASAVNKLPGRAKTAIGLGVTGVGEFACQ
ncbi:hypothetical protein [Parasitella parasitica]|uniref:Distal membrane-arm assembly complex protein 1-like domain-containing protein n=1 Tax=Parasitella parasitica TaxID=35722 RepID=A0A0B7NBE9_9FUNG|nr:hypothetical protein [Parasitella parasitica]